MFKCLSGPNPDQPDEACPVGSPRFKPRRFQRRPSEAARWNGSARDRSIVANSFVRAAGQDSRLERIGGRDYSHVVLFQSITAERSTSGSSNTHAEMSTMFYKRGCQEKYLPLELKASKISSWHPAPRVFAHGVDGVVPPHCTRLKAASVFPAR